MGDSPRPGRSLPELPTDPPLTDLPLTADDVVAAGAVIAPHVRRTPLLESAHLNELVGGRVLIKAENLQHTGSFKVRGATNWILTLTPDQCRRGVLAWSSGNHALAVSAVGKTHDVPVTLVMPSDAPRTKIDGARANGATIRLYDRDTEVREEIGAQLAAETGATIIPPYDHPVTMAGQGSVGLEVNEQIAAAGTAPDQVLVPTSGGGLVAGVATAVQASHPGARIYTVEPAGFDDHRRSFESGRESGRRESNAPGATSICDALLLPTPGEYTFDVNRRLVAGGLAVTDDEVRAAMRLAFQHLKLVVEPGGAAALAAVLAGKVETAELATVVVVTGGNVDADVFRRVLADGPALT